MTPYDRKALARVAVADTIDAFIEREMTVRGFYRLGAYWRLPELGLQVRHKRARCWFKSLDPEKWPQKLKGELDGQIARTA